MSRAFQRACAILCLVLPITHVGAAEVDARRSGVGFSLYTRWGEVIDGTFPVLNGRLTQRPDGRQQVRLALSAADVVIIGNVRHTHLTRGKGFFDAAQHPWITFESEPFDPRLLVEGGEMPGELHIRGVQRRESFTVLPSACVKPALDCPVLARGMVDRNQYGMSRWSVAVGRKVSFRLRILLHEEVE